MPLIYCTNLLKIRNLCHEQVHLDVLSFLPCRISQRYLRPENNMGQRHSHRAPEPIRYGSVNRSPENLGHGAQTDDTIHGDELPCVVDGMRCSFKSQQEKDREFWNSVMLDNPAADMNEYAKAFPWHPYRRRQCSEQIIGGAGQRKGVYPQIPTTGRSSHEGATEGVRDTATNEGEAPITGINDLTTNAIAEFDFGLDFQCPDPPSTPTLQTPLDLPSSQQPALDSSAPEDPTLIGLALSPPQFISAPVVLDSNHSQESPPWSTTLQHIFASGHMPGSIVSAISNRIPTGLLLNPQSAGPTTNFSSPATPLAHGSTHDDPGQALVNGVCSSHSSSSSSTLHGNNNDGGNAEGRSSATEDERVRNEQYEREHERPSGLPSESEMRSFSHSLDTLLDRNGHIENKLRLCEGTIASQASILRTLHCTIDIMNQQMASLQAQARDKAQETNDREGEIGALRTEITDLRALMDFSSSLVETCFEREKGTLEWVQGLQAQKCHPHYGTYTSCSRKRGMGLGVEILRRVFTRSAYRVGTEDIEMDILAADGNSEAGSEAATTDVGSTHTLRSQVDAIAEAMEQNLGLLRADFEELAVKIEAYAASARKWAE